MEYTELINTYLLSKCANVNYAFADFPFPALIFKELPSAEQHHVQTPSALYQLHRLSRWDLRIHIPLHSYECTAVIQLIPTELTRSQQTALTHAVPNVSQIWGGKM
jgi:hypothetical protein